MYTHHLRKEVAVIITRYKNTKPVINFYNEHAQRVPKDRVRRIIENGHQYFVEI